MAPGEINRQRDNLRRYLDDIKATPESRAHHLTIFDTGARAGLLDVETEIGYGLALFDIWKRASPEALHSVLQREEAREEVTTIAAVSWMLFLDQLAACKYAAIEVDALRFKPAVQQSLFSDDLRNGRRVYFMVGEDLRKVKIGHSEVSAERRRRQLQTGRPDKLTTIGVIYGAYEDKVQALFASHCISRDWFWMCPEIDAFLKSAALIESVKTR